MHLDSKGRRVVDVDLPAGEIRYQIAQHVIGGHPTNGTMSDRYEFDGGADYRSVLRVPAGRTRITFDPKKFPPSALPGALRYARPESPAARGATLISRVQQMSEEEDRRQVVALERGESLASTPKEWPAMLDELVSIIGSDPDLRYVALMLYFRYPPGPRPEAPELAEAALTELSAIDSLWTLVPKAMQHAMQIVRNPERFASKVDEAISRHPDPQLGASYLLYHLEASHAAGNPAAVSDTYQQLMSPRFSGTTEQLLAHVYDPARVLLPGKPIPSLELDALDPAPGHPSRLNLENLRGQPLLIVLWATWCKPCVAEMQELHSLHAKLKASRRKLAILSVAMDSPEAVRKFRRGRWKMPWLHAVVPEDRRMALYEQLNIVGIPVAILVDKAGQIIAASPDLVLADVPARLGAPFGSKP